MSLKTNDIVRPHRFGRMKKMYVGRLATGPVTAPAFGPDAVIRSPASFFSAAAIHGTKVALLRAGRETRREVAQ
jgi:hypothetical protein